MKLGQKLKEARTQAGHSQDAVAKIIGVSRQSVSNWENDRTYPDIGSLLKLSDLYGLSLDGMLKEDTTIPAHFEKLAARRKTICQILLEAGILLELFGLVMIGQEFLTLGYVMEGAGIVLAYAAMLGNLRYFSHTTQEMRYGIGGLALQVICMVLLLIFPELHKDWLFRVIHIFGVCLLWQSGVYGMFWKSPRVWVYLVLYAAIPLLTLTLNLRSAGGFVENNPFQHDYRVVQVLHGQEAEAEAIRVKLSNVLGLKYRLRITEPDGSSEQPGDCVYTQPLPGQTEKALWQVIPAADPDCLYRVAVEADDSVTLSRLEDGLLQYKWLLGRVDTCSVTIRTIGKTTVKSPEWYPPGSADPEPYLKNADVAGSGTLFIGVGGLETENLTLTEEYHHGETVEYREYLLEPPERGGFSLELATRYDGVEEYALYRVSFGGGEYRFTVTFGK